MANSLRQTCRILLNMNLTRTFLDSVLLLVFVGVVYFVAPFGSFSWGSFSNEVFSSRAHEEDACFLVTFFMRREKLRVAARHCDVS